MTPRPVVLVVVAWAALARGNRDRDVALLAHRRARVTTIALARSGRVSGHARAFSYKQSRQRMSAFIEALVIRADEFRCQVSHQCRACAAIFSSAGTAAAPRRPGI